MNSRPLTYISENNKDPVPLSPSMFLQDIQEWRTPDLDSVDQKSLNRRPSTCDPIQAVLRALENVDLAAEDRRVSAMKKNNPSYRSQPRSPMFQDHVDPYKTALKKIEELQMKKKAKSTRKVTFNLESSGRKESMLRMSGLKVRPSQVH
ncbi:hypothetical protein JTE90_008996 [Oedothorax gibbosus]|uniref:Uncharacterized protein n=1 Tax=Oedothorax gibbosus TaxID=931172 RepID=A0AAV6VM95_9ARAC|nr:hypothetical protein JTE90_008996 [Oedothorax gibbosus]